MKQNTIVTTLHIKNLSRNNVFFTWMQYKKYLFNEETKNLFAINFYILIFWMFKNYSFSNYSRNFRYSQFNVEFPASHCWWFNILVFKNIFFIIVSKIRILHEFRCNTMTQGVFMCFVFYVLAFFLYIDSFISYILIKVQDFKTADSCERPVKKKLMMFILLSSHSGGSSSSSSSSNNNSNNNNNNMELIKLKL